MSIGHTDRIKALLWPFSFLYGIGVRLRNLLFDWKILRTERYDLPIICVGNLTVGGTGKTPHTEYLIRMLKNRYRIAVLSRGYKRKTNGFILANNQHTSEEIGDEPHQMKQKFPEILVAVDADRRRGIRRLLSLPADKRPEVILLDDAFQHRHVIPSLNILLTDSHRLYTHDHLLPAGRLREPKHGAKRADIIIVTKCEACVQPIDFRIMEEDIHPSPYQELFFSHIQYGDLLPLFPGKAAPKPLRSIKDDSEILLVSGIASPRLLEEELHKYTKKITSMAYPDHHAFTKHDIREIQSAFQRLDPAKRLLLVTEKDAARLRDLPSLPEEWQPYLYYLPITIGFCLGKEKHFQELIIKHIQSYE